jgi:hypothetical protein
MNDPFSMDYYKIISDMSSFTVQALHVPAMLTDLDKPWFWETKRLQEDRADGIIWGNMYPKAPIDRNHPSMRLKNYQNQSLYMEVRDKTGIPATKVAALGDV